MLRRIVISLIFYFTAFNLFAQDFIVKQYRATDGLQTDMVKSINRDSFGFIWIGTDNGLIKYDGITFHEYSKATSSQYIKDIIRTRNGKLIVLHDLGIAEIISTYQDVKFKPLLKGATVISDTALWYPKSAFEDNKGFVWIAEPQSVVRINQDFKNWERFHFTQEDNSVSFVRSFSFLQLNPNSILISSYRGNYFSYTYDNEVITPLSFKGGEHEIHVLKKIGDVMFVGTNNGLHRIIIEENVVSYSDPIVRGLITDIEVIDDKSIIVCSENGFNYHLKTEKKEYKVTPIQGSKLNTNQAFVWDENIWLSTQKGVALLKKPNFRDVKLDISTMYVENITSHPESDYVYMLGKEIAWRIHKETEQSERVLNVPGGYLLSADATSKGLWLSNAFEVIYIENGKVKHRINLQKYGRFVFNITIDHQGLVWIVQEASNGLKCFDPKTNELTIYDGSKGLDFEVSAVQATEKGVYIAVAGDHSYLHFKPYGSKYFKNVSYEKSSIFSDLLAEHIIIEDTIGWMASNYGILTHTKDTLLKESIPGNEVSAVVRCMAIDKQYLIYGNQFGLYRYNIKTGNYSLFNEQTGLRANTINEEGILLEKDKLWIGTPFGLSVMDYDTAKYKKTAIPVILEMIVNGKSVTPFSEDLLIPNRAYLEIIYSSLSFPSADIQYSYRIAQNGDDWSNPSFQNVMEIANLEMGDYVFEVKARKLGNYNWSEVQRLRFSVQPALYQSWYFYFILVLIVGVFAVLTLNITRRVMKKRQLVLEKLVEHRTVELEKHRTKLEEMVMERTSDLHSVNDKLKETNEELHEKNVLINKQKDELEKTIENLKDAQAKLIESEKMASLGILTAGISHEINNPLNFIMAGYLGLENYIEDAEGVDLSGLQVHLESIKTGVDRATDIVQGLNQFSRSNEAFDEECEINTIIDNCILMIDKNYLEQVEIIKDYTSDNYQLLGNIGKLHQVFLNLIVNAAQALKGKGQISITTFLQEGFMTVIVADNGMGIPKENLRKIMEPFFTTKNPGEGTGLGLSITRRIVNEHKGTVNFQSDEGKGTTVTIKLPAKPV
jgi:signal transduction histidine kinase/ligand-binding sensor domain-containing protein